MTPRLRFGFLCPENWEDMEGDDAVRRCARCDREVLNLSGSRPVDLWSALAASGGSVCARAVVGPLEPIVRAGKVVSVAAALAACDGDGDAAPAVEVAVPPDSNPLVEPDRRPVVLTGAISLPLHPDPEAPPLGCPPDYRIELPDGTCATVVRPPAVER